LAPQCESLKTGGQFRPLPYAEATAELLATKRGVVLAHTGFARATAVTRHTRTVELEADGLRVQDTFEGEGLADVEFHWQFGSGFTSFDASRRVMKGAGGEVAVELVELGAAGKSGRWDATLLDGWISRSYGALTPIRGLSLRSEVRLPARISTCFRLRDRREI
jgi:hypothetical protein